MLKGLKGLFDNQFSQQDPDAHELLEMKAWANMTILAQMPEMTAYGNDHDLLTQASIENDKVIQPDKIAQDSLQISRFWPLSPDVKEIKRVIERLPEGVYAIRSKGDDGMHAFSIHISNGRYVIFDQNGFTSENGKKGYFYSEKAEGEQWKCDICQGVAEQILKAMAVVKKGSGFIRSYAMSENDIGSFDGLMKDLKNERKLEEWLEAGDKQKVNLDIKKSKDIIPRIAVLALDSKNKELLALCKRIGNRDDVEMMLIEKARFAVWDVVNGKKDAIPDTLFNNVDVSHLPDDLVHTIRDALIQACLVGKSGVVRALLKSGFFVSKDYLVERRSREFSKQGFEVSLLGQLLVYGNEKDIESIQYLIESGIKPTEEAALKAFENGYTDFSRKLTNKGIDILEYISQ